MPLTLKTPACPAVFLPALPWAGGAWSIEGEGTAVLRADAGAPLGVALLGAAVARREEWVKRLAEPQVAPIR